MDNWLNRTELLIGKDNLFKLQKSHIVVFGCGGVGSYVIEGLVRAGIGEITIVSNKPKVGYLNLCQSEI